MPPVIPTSAWVVVVPRLIVNRNSRFSRVAIVEAVSTASVVVAPVILRIGDVGIVIEAVPILRTLLAPGCSERRLLLGLCFSGLVHNGECTDTNRKNKKTTNHGVALPSGSARCTFGLVTTLITAVGSCLWMDRQFVQSELSDCLTISF